MRRGIAAIITAVALTVLGAGRATGQQLHGTVTDSASGLPIPGAVLLLLDSTGTTRGRNLTGARGTYRVTLVPELRRMRVLRLGFRPRDVDLPSDSARDHQLDVRMTMVPTLLEPVRSTDVSSCPQRKDAAAALALWDQARAGLLAAVVGRDIQPPRVVLYRFEREMDGDDIVSQTITVDSVSRATKTFSASRTAAEFVRFGFALDAGESRIFYGPDASVLLDDAFARGYCFRLEEGGRSRRGQIGLGFASATTTRDRVDIDGALWIDTVARKLVDIQFRYTGLDRATNAFHPGGAISFREMATGMVLIDRWHLRLVGATPDSNGLRWGQSERLPTAHLVAHEVGGEVARAEWPDGTIWRDSLGTWSGLLTHGAEPVGAGVRISLRGTPYIATTDGASRFTIRELLPGPYHADISDSALAAGGFVQDSSVAFTSARDTVRGGRYSVATLDDYIANACHKRLDEVKHRSIILGRVLGATGRPLSNVVVRDTLELMAGEVPAVSDTTRYFTGTNGEYKLCFSPRDAHLRVTAFHDDAVLADSVQRVDRTRHVYIVNLRLAPRDR